MIDQPWDRLPPLDVSHHPAEVRAVSQSLYPLRGGELILQKISQLSKFPTGKQNP
jgi:hypothetical protein